MFSNNPRDHMHDKDSKLGFHKSKTRILVVDDEHEVAGNVRDVLVYEGFEVETAGNGRQALDLLMSGRRFDLVITDIRMPEMDGLELLRKVRQLSENLPVIVMTGNATTKKALRPIGEGAFDYISKPFGIKVLIRVVYEALKDNCCKGL